MTEIAVAVHVSAEHERESFDKGWEVDHRGGQGPLGVKIIFVDTDYASVLLKFNIIFIFYV